MLVSLIQAHEELEEELERAISDDCASPVIEAIDTKIVNLDTAIRQAVPANDDEVRLKLRFYLSRIVSAGDGLVNERDIATVEEMFEHILSGTVVGAQNNPQLLSGKKS